MSMDHEEISKLMNQYIEEKRFDAMYDFSETLIQENEENYLGKWWKARALTFLGDTDEALSWFMKGLMNAASDEEESKIMSSIANIYNIRKEWEKALKYTDIALELNPLNVVGVVAKSVALTALGRKRDAQMVLVSNSGLIVTDYQKACVAAIKGDKTRMLEYLEKAVGDNPHVRVSVQYDPEFMPYRRDPDFRKILF